MAASGEMRRSSVAPRSVFMNARKQGRLTVTVAHRALLICACLSCAACATTEKLAAQDAAQYAAHCEKQGHKRNTEAWQACMQTEELNAGLATQRAYDRKLLRKLDCVDPRFAC